MAILIVDDSDINRHLLHMLLDRIGHEAVEARDGLHALEQLELHPAIDVAIVDIMMPRMNGWGLIAAMRERPEWRAMPIVLCTTVADREAVQQAVALGIRNFLVKPVTRERLTTALGEALKNVPGRLPSRDAVLQKGTLGAQRYAEVLRALRDDATTCAAVERGPDELLQRIVENCRAVGAERSRMVVGRAANGANGRSPAQVAAMLQTELRLLAAAADERLTALDGPPPDDAA